MPRRLSRVQSDPLLREGRTNTQSDTPIIILVPTSVPLSFKARGVFVVGGTTVDKGGREERMDIGWIVARLDLSVDDESLREFLKRKNVLSSTLNFSIYSSKESRFFFPVFFFPSLEHACNRERGMKTRQAKRNKISVHGGVKLQEESRGSKIYTS